MEEGTDLCGTGHFHQQEPLGQEIGYLQKKAGKANVKDYRSQVDKCGERKAWDESVVQLKLEALL